MSRSHKKTPIRTLDGRNRSSQHARRAFRRLVNSGSLAGEIGRENNLYKMTYPNRQKVYIDNKQASKTVHRIKHRAKANGSSKIPVRLYSFAGRKHGKPTLADRLTYYTDMYGGQTFSAFRHNRMRNWYKDYYHK